LPATQAKEWNSPICWWPVALSMRHQPNSTGPPRTWRAPFFARPAAGTVLTIHARPGEHPGSAGVLDFGDTRVMTAEVELYQADVVSIGVGQRAKLHSPALAVPLTGVVSRVGLSVGRQRLTDTSPGANIDARVVLATVALDDESSSRSRRLVGLEVKADIETGTP
jgi:HlyD family secretion protein